MAAPQRTPALDDVAGETHQGTPTAPAARTYRGRSLDELIPRIRAELGDDAVITRQREGLMGGVGGFFQKQFVEVEATSAGHAPAPALPAATDARPPERRLDVTVGEFESLALENLISSSTTDFDAQLAAAQAQWTEPPAAGPAAPAPAAPVPAATEPAPAPAAPAPERAAPASAVALEQRLCDAGMPAALAAEIVGEAVAHGLPFAGTRALRRLVREGVARRLPVTAPRPAGPRAIAFVGASGAGKTRCAARLAAAYASAGDMRASALALMPADGGSELRDLLDLAGVPVHVSGAPRHGLLAIDTPGLGARDAEGIAALAEALGETAPDEVLLVLPATTGLPAARELLAAMAPCGITGIALTHADETDTIGAVLTLSIEAGLPIAYVGSGTLVLGGLEPADPRALAGKVV